MKKLFVYLMTGTLALGMTACGNRKDTPQSTEQMSEEQSQGSENTAPETENGGAEAQETEGMDISAGWSEEMEGIRQAVVDALGDNYWPDTQIVPEMLEGVYGITADMYDDYMGESPMISANVDTLLIIRAKDGKVDEVEEALHAYREMLVNDTMQYPMNLGKIQASRIERFGNYVCFVQLGADTTQAEESGEEAVIQQCQEQNELAIEVIGHSIPQ